MESIKSLVNQKFTLFNVGSSGKYYKRPICKTGDGLLAWESVSCSTSIKQHDYTSRLWGMRMGLHENGRRIMSLDFDTCGEPDKVNGGRLGCEYTKQLFARYLETADSQDGLYYSSTAGNANVLIDYTDCPTIIEMAEKIGSKFNLQSFECLFGNKHQQVIPPSSTTCKITNKLGQPRAFVADTFYIMNEESTLFPFVRGLFEEKLKGKPKPTRSASPISSTNNFSSEDEVENVVESDDEWLELLNNVIKNEVKPNGEYIIKWNEWLQIGNTLKSNKYPFQKWLDYTKKANPTVDKENMLNMWNGFKNYFSIYNLQSLAKLINLTGYKEWCIKYSKWLPLDKLEKGENDTAEYIKEQLKTQLVYCTKRWIGFNKDTGLWNIDIQPFSNIITHIQDKIDESRSIVLDLKQREQDTDKKKKFEEDVESYKKFYILVGKNAFSSQITKILQTKLLDDEFISKLNQTPYVVAYKNGVLNLKTGLFRVGLRSNDFLSHTIPYDYKKSTVPDQLHIRQQLKKICNNNEAQLEYYLSTLGCSLLGDATLTQDFWCLRGQTACNGKSVVFDALSAIIPNYVCKVESNTFEISQDGNRHKTIATLLGKRIVWINELSSRKQNGDVLKEISDGAPVSYKMMYGNSTIMPTTFKMYMISNHTINVDGDKGVSRRIKMMQFDSTFGDFAVDNYETCKFVRNNAFGKELADKYKYALMDLIYSYSKKFVEDGCKLKAFPSEWSSETEDCMDNNNPFKEFFEENFETGKEFKTTKLEFQNRHLIKNGVKTEVKNINDGLRAIGVIYTYKKDNGAYWNGFRLKPPVVSSEETVSEPETEEYAVEEVMYQEY